MFDLSGKRILVTGITGFLGRAVSRKLIKRGCRGVFNPRERFDLTSPIETAELFNRSSPKIVFHLAAKCGGIGANMAAPAEFMRDNLLMGLNVIEQARHCGAKVVLVGTVCSYPAFSAGPIREGDMWFGYPEKTNAPYGIAKRALGELLAAYHKQYGLSCAYVIPANLYGPGDNFNPETSHVIPALIRKFTDAAKAGEHDDNAGLAKVTCWGTGQATRDFLYVDDAAEAIMRAAERIETPDPINLGTGREISIRGLAERIAALCGFNGSIRWDKSKPDGQMRRVLDTTRQKERLEWMPSIGLEEGLAQTVRWWQAQQREVATA